MMSDDSGKSKKLSLSGSRLTLGGLEAGQLRATPGGAGRRTVQVEVRRKRAPAAPHRAATQKAEPAAAPPQAAATAFSLFFNSSGLSPLEANRRRCTS